MSSSITEIIQKILRDVGKPAKALAGERDKPSVARGQIFTGSLPSGVMILPVTTARNH
ncbi:hypothetical protein [Desulfovibrio sp. TomC]|uniref:hypothetical protein n=1 Tax=Desulfovibrio sp. TomC TaxID=1562888 RepID=UPI0012E0CA8F|nr:hypothetical protein [Desulfovibrio sp. TomC]